MRIPWISKIFSSVGTDILRVGRDIIDDLHTSTEEKLEIKAEFEIKMETLLNEADIVAMDHETKMEEEVTRRLKIDMTSDSWLSKNIRPIALIFLTMAVAILSYATLLNKGLTLNQLEALKIWIPFYTILMVTVYSFYFGSRGIEKGLKIVSGRRHKNESK